MALIEIDGLPSYKMVPIFHGIHRHLSRSPNASPRRPDGQWPFFGEPWINGGEMMGKH